MQESIRLEGSINDSQDVMEGVFPPTCSMSSPSRLPSKKIILCSRFKAQGQKKNTISQIMLRDGKGASLRGCFNILHRLARTPSKSAPMKEVRPCMWVCVRDSSKSETLPTASCWEQWPLLTTCTFRQQPSLNDPHKPTSNSWYHYVKVRSDQ